MTKNIAIVVLIVLVVGMGGYILRSKMKARVMSEVKEKVTEASGSPAPKPPMFIGKGQKLADSPLAKMAYKVAPGEISADAKTALAGFKIDTKKNADGSLTVTFIPKDQDDQQQVYTVKSGETLYFVEVNPGDDNPASDKEFNLRDDYGVLVDKDGIVL